MKIKIKRTDFTENSTIGELYIDDVFECFTLEDKSREPGIKIDGQTAIPYDTYFVAITFSNRFQRLLPLIFNQPDLTVRKDGITFSGVRVHTGNKSTSTEGCILVGETKEKDFIGNSKAAFSKLFAKMQTAMLNKENIVLTIV